MKKDKRKFIPDPTIKTESEFNLNIEPVCMVLMAVILIFIAIRSIVLYKYMSLTGDIISVYTVRNAFYIFTNISLFYFVFHFFFHVTTSPGKKVQWDEMKRVSLFALICSIIKALIVLVIVIPHFYNYLHLVYLICDIIGWTGLATFFYSYYCHCKEEIRERELWKQRIDEQYK